MPANTLPRPGAAPDDVAVAANHNLQSGHPGPHALDCIHQDDRHASEPSGLHEPRPQRPEPSAAAINRPRAPRRR